MPPLFPTNPSATYGARFVLLLALYAAAGWLSFLLIPLGGSGASLVWPVAAIGLAGLLFWGLNLWPALVLGLFLVLMARDFPPSVAAGVAVGNAIEAVIGSYLLARVGFHPLMSRLRDTLGLILAAFVATFFSSALIAGSASVFLHTPFSIQLLTGLWIGHSVSILSFAPFVIRWGYRPLFIKTIPELIEGSIGFPLIAALNILIFWTPYGTIGSISLIYVLIIPLIWASLRTGPRGTTLAVFLTAAIGTSGILWGYGPITANAADALFGVQVLIGTLSIIFLLFTSITEERKEAVIALEGHVGKLEDALEKISLEDKAKAEFIAILAHELRNPLSPVLSGLEILKSKETEPRDVLHMMGAHLNTLARLLDDLLDITRISQKKFKLEREAATLQDIISRSLEMTEPFLASKGHTFTKSLPKEDILIEADPVRLTQVFVNLLNNAGKYTPKNGIVHLALSREGHSATVRVKDNGQGIARERRREVFEAFAGVAQRSEGPGGLHIGLSLAKRMVELHQGTIEVHSAGAGHGSEFIVRLPLPAVIKKPPLPAATPQKARGRFSKDAVRAARAAGTLRILVVDDNQSAAQLLGTLLEHNGHTVSLAYSGTEALEASGRNRPQVALIDIGLPDISGYEVAKRMRAQFGYDIGLVALTGYGQQDDRDRSRDAGFDDHLVKPVSIVDVEHALAQLRRDH